MMLSFKCRLEFIVSINCLNIVLFTFLPLLSRYWILMIALFLIRKVATHNGKNELQRKAFQFNVLQRSQTLGKELEKAERKRKRKKCICELDWLYSGRVLHLLAHRLYIIAASTLRRHPSTRQHFSLLFLTFYFVCPSPSLLCAHTWTNQV